MNECQKKTARTGLPEKTQKVQDRQDSTGKDKSCGQLWLDILIRQPCQETYDSTFVTRRSWHGLDCIASQDSKDRISCKVVITEPQWRDKYDQLPCQDRHNRTAMKCIGGHLVRYPWSAISDWAWYRNFWYRTERAESDIISDIGIKFYPISDIRHPHHTRQAA